MEDQLKTCKGCGLRKELSFFSKGKGSSGTHFYCKECCKIKKREWYIKNSEKCKKYSKNYVAKNYDAIKDKRKDFYDKNKDIILKRNKIRRRTDKCRELARKQRARWLDKPQNKISCNLRNRIRKSLKGISKLRDTEKLTSCDFVFLKKYLESKFLDGMTWENYGLWHIDHIKPCSSFDLTKPEEQLKCFHYTNLQPLWAMENLKKGNKLI